MLRKRSMEEESATGASQFKMILRREPYNPAGDTAVSDRHATSQPLTEITSPTQRILDAGAVAVANQPANKPATKGTTKHVDWGPLERYRSSSSSLPTHKAPRQGVPIMFQTGLNVVKRKLGLGGVAPMNNLNREQDSSPQAADPSPGNIRSSFTPNKRQKIQTEDAFTECSFAPIAGFDGISDASPRRPSINSTHSTSDLRGTRSVQSSSHKANQGNVPELRQVDQYFKPPSKKRQRHKNADSSTRHENTDSLKKSPFFLIEVSDNEQDHKQQASHGNQVEVSGESIANRFRRQSEHLESGSSQHSGQKRKATANTMQDPKKQKRSSPDPLGHDHDGSAQVRSKSKSVSRKGDIPPTIFSSSAKPGQQQQIGRRRPSDATLAKHIIGSTGLRVRRGVSGPYAYPAPDGSCPPPCFLRSSGVSTVLVPTDENGQLLKDHIFLGVDLNHVLRMRTPETTDHFIVSIGRSVDLGAPGKLHLEFTALEEMRAFLKWADMQRIEAVHFEHTHCDGQQLDKEILNLAGKATAGKLLRDTDEPKAEMQVQDDIKVIEFNRARQLRESQSSVEASQQVASVSGRKVKVKDSMQTPGRFHQNVEPTGVSDRPPSSNTRYAQAFLALGSPPSSTSRQTRATARTIGWERSPTPIRPWTERNPEWKARWTKSLVFPAEGKSRATVDLDDIQRLDEGQFLNDNLIIFYLRYLQYRLETTRPELAERVYFHNTFFYDKLKPSRSSAGINYESVKGWTSKVDLFTKDFIIVPINEYAHWYVAIIYNAPKLVPSIDSEPRQEARNASDPIEVDGDDATSANVIANAVNVMTDFPALAENAVTENFNRMSISSTDSINNPKETKSNRPQSDQGGHQPMQMDGIIDLIKDSDDTKLDAEDLPSLGSLGQKKPAKRSGRGGPRKQNPNQAKIITLDSLGSSHSPACTYLKQYLVAELKDKKGLDMQVPRTLGMTANDVPQQTNFCDCGLYLLGYISQLLLDPDKFVRSILQGDYASIEWDFEFSDLRDMIRKTIFEEGYKQQKREEARMKEKRRAAIAKRDQSSRPSSSDGPTHHQHRGDAHQVEPKQAAVSMASQTSRPLTKKDADHRQSQIHDAHIEGKPQDSLAEPNRSSRPFSKGHKLVLRQHQPELSITNPRSGTGAGLASSQPSSETARKETSRNIDASSILRRKHQSPAGESTQRKHQKVDLCQSVEQATSRVGAFATQLSSSPESELELVTLGAFPASSPESKSATPSRLAHENTPRSLRKFSNESAENFLAPLPSSTITSPSRGNNAQNPVDLDYLHGDTPHNPVEVAGGEVEEIPHNNIVIGIRTHDQGAEFRGALGGPSVRSKNESHSSPHFPAKGRPHEEKVPKKPSYTLIEDSEVKTVEISE